MDSPLERSCLHTRSDLKTLGRAREGYGLWARLGCVAIRGWAPPALEKATNSKGNSEAKRKAKGRKPDAWRSRRGRRAGDPTSKALRPPGDAPSRPERWVATPRPRGGRAGVGTRGSRRGRRRAEWRERRRCGDGGRGVRPQHRPGKRGAPAPRGGPRSPWRPPQTCMATEAALRHQPAGRGQGRSP